MTDDAAIGRLASQYVQNLDKIKLLSSDFIEAVDHLNSLRSGLSTVNDMDTRSVLFYIESMLKELSKKAALDEKLEENGLNNLVQDPDFYPQTEES